MRRSLLFLPGNNPNMLINAGCLGADAVIFDLEDAVSPAEKDAARILVRNTMRYIEPSTVFLGLISGQSLCLPKNLPPKYAKVSVIHEMIKGRK